MNEEQLQIEILKSGMTEIQLQQIIDYELTTLEEIQNLKNGLVHFEKLIAWQEKQSK